MSIKRMLLAGLAVMALLVAIGSAPTALGSDQHSLLAQDNASAALTIPYSGRLTDRTGAGPVADGAYDLAFTLYEAAIGGTPLWSETVTGAAVQAGNFTTFLGSINPLSKDILDKPELWLAVAVRGPGESAFTDLNPRQRLIDPVSVSPSSPTAGPSCPHDHVGETWNAAIAWSNGAFKVTNSLNGPSIWGVNTGGGSAVRGDGYGATSIGVYGEGDSGPGTVGRSATGNGVEGWSTSGNAGFFSSNQDQLDLALGGDVGRINANSSATSQLYLSSNADVIVKLDNDSGGNNVFRVKNSGGGDACTIDEAGNLACAGSKAGYVADIAQNDEATALTQGEVVAISGTGPAVLGEIPVIKVRRATAADAAAVIGIVDQRYNPGAPDSPYATADIAPGEYFTLVTLGSYKAIKVDATYGPIKPGDLLVASPHAGYAMRADAPNSGTIVGKALGELKSGTGTIAVIVTLQ